MKHLNSLRLHTKVSLAICVPCMLVSALVIIGWTTILVRSHKQQFKEHYQSLSDHVASTLHELEVVTDMAGQAVLTAFAEQEAQGQFKTIADLRAFADEMGVSALYMYDDSGSTAFWTHPPADPSFNVFDMCVEYTDFFSRGMQRESSPFVPVANAPSIKFFKSLNKQGNRVLTVAIYSTFLDDLLLGSFKGNRNIIDIDVRTPSGASLRTGNPADPVREGEHARFFSRTPSTALDCCQCVQKGLSTSRDNYFYNVVVDVSTRALKRICWTARLLGATIFLFSAAFALAIARLLATHLVSRIESIDRVAANVFKSGDLNIAVPAPSHDDEIGRLSMTFNAMLASLRESQESALAHERASSIAGHARQVAHDIRSPLAAIRMALSELGETPEETRRLLRSATFRIEDISNQLFEVNAGVESRNSPREEEMRPTLLTSALELIVSEKRTEYRHHLHVNIEFSVEGNSYGEFVALVASDFKRVVSNLINNSVEALGGSGNVRISVKRQGADAIIEIADNGCGMPPDVLQKLGREEITHGKPGGHGIGVHSAHTVLKQFGGYITYESSEGMGTCARVTLPLADAPSWFLDKLQVDAESSVVIVDDDISIHDVWNERFRRGAPEVKVDHVSSPKDLEAHVRSMTNAAGACYLVDFEFLGNEETGIDLIERLAIANHSVLVTSRFEEEEVLAGCKRLGVRMIPKSAAQYVPITRQAKVSTQSLDAVFLDDDPLIRKSWSMGAKRAGLQLKTYATEQALLCDISGFSPMLPIYVDFDLNGARTGLQVAEDLAKKGFTRIFLATGFPKQEIKCDARLEDVIGKEPPF